MIDGPPLAHSARNAGSKPQSYAEHVCETVRHARANAQAAAAFMADPMLATRFVAAVVDAATFHDLGKLDEDNQAALRQGRNGRMQWDHVDAGVAYLMEGMACAAAWIVRAHHAPGLPSEAHEFNALDSSGRRLRGGRFDEHDAAAAEDLAAHTDHTLPRLLQVHIPAVGAGQLTPSAARHGLFMRLALSCQVDADHTDSARHEHGWLPPDPPPPRWPERLRRLDTYVAGLPKGGPRQADRDAFYAACREGQVNASLVACEGSVGIGKTTAVMAWCLRRAIAGGARRIFVVAPYTTILSQTARILRKALVLSDEREDEIVGEHHHRAEFEAIGSRDLATLWRAPVVVTTSVQFFETLASCEPARLRKLHGLPGSVVFLDEAHATLSAPLWRQNWAWMQELTSSWACSFILASGSLARVWSEPDIVSEAGLASLPNVAPQPLAVQLDKAEYARIRYRTLGRIENPAVVISAQPGPRLAVFNTVQTAAVIADRLRKADADVLHLSTALCPLDRDRILLEVQRRLDPATSYTRDWTLVATSLVEAGVDLSFRTGLRERFSAASLIQVGGRVNRHGRDETGEVLDFLISADGQMITHPGADTSSAVLGQLFRDGCFGKVFNPATLVTQALRLEIRNDHGKNGAKLAQAEMDHDYPAVARLGRLIDADTALMVVEPSLRQRLDLGAPVDRRELLEGSVAVWSMKLKQLGIDPLPGRPGLHVWKHPYEPAFLGYMAGALRFLTGEAFFI